MKLTTEDINKYGTTEEQEFLKESRELPENYSWAVEHLVRAINHINMLTNPGVYPPEYIERARQEITQAKKILDTKMGEVLRY